MLAACLLAVKAIANPDITLRGSRVAQLGDLHHSGGGQGIDCGVEKGIQSGQITWCQGGYKSPAPEAKMIATLAL